MSEKKERNIIYDKVRGVAILLVVLGHVIQYSYSDFFHVPAFNIIYSFHMPLFMFLSGLVTYKKERQLDFLWLKTKFFCLVIPFLSWMLLPFMFNRGWKGGLIVYLKNVIMNPDNANWFLWILFLMCLINCLSTQLSTRLRIEHSEIIVVLIVLFLGIVKMSYFGVPLLRQHAKFYFTGYYISKYKSKIWKPTLILGAICGTVWIFAVPYWRFLGDYPFKPLLENLLVGVVGDVDWRYQLLYITCIEVYNTILSFGGIFLTFTVVFVLEKVIGNIKLLNYSLSYLGKNTLEIYVIHSYFLGVTHGFNSTIRVIIDFCICIFITITIILCFQKNKVSTLLFGKRYI